MSTSKNCYLFDAPRLKYDYLFKTNMFKLWGNPNIKKIGFSISGDFRSLEEQFKVPLMDMKNMNVVDL